MAYKYPYDNEEREYKPARQLPTNRGMWKLMILNVLTLGVYGIFFFIPFTFDLDKVAPKPDRSQTMNYLFAYLLSLITFSVVLTVWQYQVAVRVSDALREREIDYELGVGDFWGWYYVGSLILVGPFIYFHKLCTAMNLLCEDYNRRGGQA